MAAFPDRAPNAVVLTAAHAAAYPHAVATAVAATTATAAADLPIAPTSPAAEVVATAASPTARRVGAEPFWVDMITPAGSDPSTPVPSAQPSTVHADVRGEHHRNPVLRDQAADVATDQGRQEVLTIPGLDADPGRERVHRWDLVVVELGCQPPNGRYDGVGLLGADLLAPGGVLAVLTHSERRGGRLIDPTGSVVASAQAADLLYLQHIVLLTGPLHAAPPGTRTGAEPSAGSPAADTRHGAEGAVAGDEPTPGDGVMDLLLFLQPGGPGQSSAPGDRLAADPPAGPPDTPPVETSPAAARRVVNGDCA